jgi:hypothetical protein
LQPCNEKIQEIELSMRTVKRPLFFLILPCLFALEARAQKFEIDPYAGAFASGRVAHLFKVSPEGIYGVRGGVFTNNYFEFEGNFGYINKLELRGTLTKKKLFIWEGLATYNFPRFHHWYASFGLGGVTATVSQDSIDFWGAAIPSRDTYLSLSYGGGFKTFRKWGPVGYRADVRGRTLPNYNGFAFNWVEMTGGLTFARGGR